MDIYLNFDYQYWLVSTSVDSQSSVEIVNFDKDIEDNDGLDLKKDF